MGWLVEQGPELADGYVVAADQDQANRLLDRARGFVRRTPALARVVRVEADRIVNVASGARVHVLAADVASGEGLLSPFIVAEEVPNWTTTQTARRTCGHWSCRRSRSGQARRWS